MHICVGPRRHILDGSGQLVTHGLGVGQCCIQAVDPRGQDVLLAAKDQQVRAQHVKACTGCRCLLLCSCLDLGCGA